MAKWWSTAIQKEDPLHVERDVLPIIHFIKTEKQTHVIVNQKSSPNTEARVNIYLFPNNVRRVLSKGQIFCRNCTASPNMNTGAQHQPSRSGGKTHQEQPHTQDVGPAQTLFTLSSVI